MVSCTQYLTEHPRNHIAQHLYHVPRNIPLSKVVGRSKVTIKYEKLCVVDIGSLLKSNHFMKYPLVVLYDHVLYVHKSLTCTTGIFDKCLTTIPPSFKGQCYTDWRPGNARNCVISKRATDLFSWIIPYRWRASKVIGLVSHGPF